MSARRSPFCVRPSGLRLPALAVAAIAFALPAAAEGPAALSALEREAATVSAELGGVQIAQQQLNSTQAAQFDRRIAALEQELRGLTGRLEDLEFRIRQLQQSQERFESETKARLLRLEEGAGGSGPAPTATYTPPDDAGQTQAAGTRPSGNRAGGPGPREPRTLGTVSEEAVAGLRPGGATVQPPLSRDQGQTQGQAQGQAGASQSGATQSAAAVGLPQNDPEAAYRTAFDELRQMNYPAAESAFGEYLQLYPDSPLAGNAKYWLGETHYVRGDYEAAAVIFAEGYQEYPQSGKAPDNLLKLGMSLANMGVNQDACATFAELQRRYPDAAPTILQRARREASRLGC